MHIHVLNTGGLSNIIKALVSAFRLTRDVSCKWKPMREILLDGLIASDAIPSNHQIIHTWQLVTKPAQCAMPQTYDFAYDRMTPDMKSMFLPSFDYLKSCIKKDIRDAVDAFLQANTFEVAMHIRSWTDDPARHEKYYDCSLYEAEIKSAITSGQTILVCADDPLIVQALKNKYAAHSGAILTYDDPSLPCKHTTFCYSEGAARRALIEMLLLSHAKQTLVGSYLSTFTECAWWFGGCKQDVVLPCKTGVFRYPSSDSAGIS